METAHRMGEAEGWRAVTIRRIAAEIDYSAPVIYQHFPSKDSVLRTLLEQGNGELAERMRHAAAGGPVAQGPYLASAAYVEFARTRPGLHQLMSGAPGADVDATARRAAAAEVIAFTRELISAWAEETSADPGSVEDACDLLWGTLLGLASIGSIEDIGFDRALRLTRQAVTALLGYWSSPAAPSAGHPQTIEEKT
nr:TetR/AcrR family transcriptional regulator [Streptomyces sp. SID5785]